MLYAKSLEVRILSVQALASTSLYVPHGPLLALNSVTDFPLALFQFLAPTR